jgi:hypothetical protein
MRKLIAPQIAILAALAAASLIPLYAAWSNHFFVGDDAYITLTYAKNVLAGRGFVFNHPPAVLGTTTPLLTLTLTLAALAGLIPTIPMPAMAVFVTAICWAGTAWLFVLFRRAWRLSLW